MADKINSRLNREFRLGDYKIVPCKEGSKRYCKGSWPIRYGRYVEIKSCNYIFNVNLNGEIKHIQGRCESWPHPAEWLKRTPGSDWVYYSSENYTTSFSYLGEHYAPCFSYPTNSIFGENPINHPGVTAAISAWEECRTIIAKATARGGLPPHLQPMLKQMAAMDQACLEWRAEEFHRIAGGRISVLPPDCRHVDYDVIPIIAADGCLYNCDFCRVKSGRAFSTRNKSDIKRQILELKNFYAADLRNYNSIFLGAHDALLAGREILEFAAETAYKVFQFDQSLMSGANLFLFGSPGSLLSSPDSLLEALNALPYKTYINVGLESPDPAALEALGRDTTPRDVEAAFKKMHNVNCRFENIQVTANFVLGSKLPEGHIAAVKKLTAKKDAKPPLKGVVYFSPMTDENPDDSLKRKLLGEFRKLKTASILPAYLYLIQRL